MKEKIKENRTKAVRFVAVVLRERGGGGDGHKGEKTKTRETSGTHINSWSTQDERQGAEKLVHCFCVIKAVAAVVALKKKKKKLMMMMTMKATEKRWKDTEKRRNEQRRAREESTREEQEDKKKEEEMGGGRKTQT